MNKKLRLLVTAKCHNKCPMCCNNQFDFEKIPVVGRLDYDEISITGGEPLLPDCNGKTMWLAHGIRSVFRTLGIPVPRLFLYTAWVLITEHSAIAAMTSTESVSRSTASPMWKSSLK